MPAGLHINRAREVYVESVSSRAKATDDKDGHFVVVPGASIGTRYKIIRQLGQGTFGKVLCARDMTNGKRYAIKVIRAIPKYRDASRIELRALATLRSYDKDNVNRCIHLRDCFDYLNHVCIVTDLLSISIYDFMKRNMFAPFPTSHIQRFIRQLFRSVAFLHDIGLIHTDLKPENILLVDSSYDVQAYRPASLPSASSLGSSRKLPDSRFILRDTTIHLIDFGSAAFYDEHHSSVVSTRHYRAPEIILGNGWSFPCDTWSLGCIVVELFTGEALFQTHDNLEHLAIMEAILDEPVDAAMVKMAPKQIGGRFFTPEGKLAYPGPDTSKQSKRYVKSIKKLDDILPLDIPRRDLLLDLLHKIFQFDPWKRISVVDALLHPWLRVMINDEGSSSIGGGM
ncbi:hypothetical protein CANCADRAFT_23714 [Tortispora caseinolytica NRRL Y-17796]|uniref:Protein kinase domain-containing protein n=1 Tax=Tortispora caseinolytica NRRL Y-17796 TaxID=767744 RepID=A0A1E4TK65_9ASCO|nr:hypothetical protein CANCADRAFT_23714 [Tortispora caseinolytica NRRL Y-17796]